MCTRIERIDWDGFIVFVAFNLTWHQPIHYRVACLKSDILSKDRISTCWVKIFIFAMVCLVIVAAFEWWFYVFLMNAGLSSYKTIRHENIVLSLILNKFRDKPINCRNYSCQTMYIFWSIYLFLKKTVTVWSNRIGTVLLFLYSN